MSSNTSVGPGGSTPGKLPARKPNNHTPARPGKGGRGPDAGDVNLNPYVGTYKGRV